LDINVTGGPAFTPTITVNSTPAPASVTGTGRNRVAEFHGTMPTGSVTVSGIPAGYRIVPGTNLNLPASNAFTLPARTATMNIPIEPIPAPTDFVIRFNPNSPNSQGSIADIPFQIPAGQEGILFTDLPTSGLYLRPGHILIGWRQGHPQGAFLPISGSPFVTGNTTLYAEWLPLF